MRPVLVERRWQLDNETVGSVASGVGQVELKELAHDADTLAHLCSTDDAGPTGGCTGPAQHVADPGVVDVVDGGGNNKFVHSDSVASCDTERVIERNVLGGELEPCGTDPVTGFFRDGCCSTGPEDLGSHTICAVMTAEFLEHQRSIGNNLSTPMPQYRFPGLVPGDRWCVTAANWLRAHHADAAAPVVLGSTHERALDIVPLVILRQHAVDVPSDLRGLE